jgi:cytochrome c oxidase cbb3-type subunit 3
MVDVVKVIHQGVPSKGMISWKTLMSKEEIEQVASYILTLHGTNPANPKAPQGEKFDY